MQAASPQALIFDLDGTLVDTLGDFDIALARTLADLGLPAPPRQLVEHSVGKGSEHLLRTVIAYQLQHPASLADADPLAEPVQALLPRAWERYQHHYLQINGDFAAVYPGVTEGLCALRDRGFALACVTNKPLAFARALLEKKGLAQYFTQVAGGDSFARKKPDPLPLLKSCEALGTRPGDTWMVGDSSNDAEAARAATCPLVLVTYGYNHGLPVRQIPALAWLDTLADLPDLL